MIELSQQQQKFHDTIIDWLKTKSSYLKNQYIVCSGYAGTGKTTILGELVKTLNKNYYKIACATYTGKASHVLASKIQNYSENYSDYYCGTIHGLIYIPEIDKKTKKLIGFIRRSVIDCDVIIIDECSMIDKSIFEDILSFKIPIIFIGDDAQLPPVSKEKFNIFKNTKFKLTEIHRQAEKSPIIKMSMIVRNGDELKNGLYGKGCIKTDWDNENAKMALFRHDPNQNDIVLCGINKTRITINQMMRAKLNFNRVDPMINEKIICLYNNHDIGIMNGQIGFIQSIKLFEDYAYQMKIKFDSMYDISTDHLIFKNGFNQINQKDYFEISKNGKIKIDCEKNNFSKLDLMDYGYCVTIHKAQGSQWNRVILINERTYYMNDENYRKWLYTGITRAAEKILIIDNF